MRVQKSFRLLVCALVLVTFAFSAFADDDQYKFDVTNNTGQTIKKLLASEDGEEYGFFNIGAGIAPGKTVTLVWDKSTNGESCNQHFKAVFADGAESEPAEFDFCESEVALEFND